MQRLLRRGAVADAAAAGLRKESCAQSLLTETFLLGCVGKGLLRALAPRGPLRPSRVLMCSRGIRCTAPSAGSGSGSAASLPGLCSELPRSNGLVELNLRNLSLSASPQAKRFADGPLKAYDTAQRHAIRQALWGHATSSCANGNPHDTKKVYVTGVGGNGKSHNLALFVHQARQAGAAVAYIHDMQQWLDDPLMILREIRFAASNAGLETPAVVTKILSKELDDAQRATKENKIAEATRTLRGSCTAKGVPFIVVIDQDDRLNRLRGKQPLTFCRFDGMIRTMKPHLLVLGGSANNECRNERDWPRRIEHYPEPVPAEWRADLFPKTQASDEIKRMMEDDFDNYPLMLAAAEAALLAGATSKAVVLQALVKSLTARINGFVSDLFTEKQSDVLAPRFIETTEMFLDKDRTDYADFLVFDRDRSYVSDDGRLHGIFPLATQIMRDCMFRAPEFPVFIEFSFCWPVYLMHFELNARNSIPGLEVKLLRKVYLQAADLRLLQSRCTLFKNGATGESFDFLLLDQREQKLRLTFYQLTPTMFTDWGHQYLFEKPSFLPRSVYDECLANVKAQWPDRDVSASFVYVSSKAEMKLAFAESEDQRVFTSDDDWVPAESSDHFELKEEYFPGATLRQLPEAVRRSPCAVYHLGNVTFRRKVRVQRGQHHRLL